MFDFDAFFDRCSGDEVFARTLMLRFRDRLPNTCRELASAVRCADPAARQLAHTLKGTAANLGANALRATAERLEQELKAARFPAATELLAVLDADKNSCLASLNNYLVEEALLA